MSLHEITATPEFLAYVQYVRDPGLVADLAFLHRVREYADYYRRVVTAVDDAGGVPIPGSPSVAPAQLDEKKQADDESVALAAALHARCLALVHHHLLGRDEQRALAEHPVYQAVHDQVAATPSSSVLAAGTRSKDQRQSTGSGTASVHSDQSSLVLPPAAAAAAQWSDIALKTPHPSDPDGTDPGPPPGMLTLLRIPAPPQDTFIVLTVTSSHARHLTAHAARDAIVAHLLATPAMSLADLDPSLFRALATCTTSYLRHTVLPQFDVWAAQDVESPWLAAALAVALLAVGAAGWVALTLALDLDREWRVVGTAPCAFAAGVAWGCATRGVRVWRAWDDGHRGRPLAVKGRDVKSDALRDRIATVRARVAYQMVYGALVFALTVSVACVVFVPSYEYMRQSVEL
ncbi:hypothetical protein H9P43_007000 [Blastocladiella emersonii ATCC 22665]|nr:hypothetical protein H9P43_007000 [Blastocladiella emersonii ATCC 22665]